jgi:hypothetical protein
MMFPRQRIIRQWKWSATAIQLTMFSANIWLESKQINREATAQ